MGKRVARKSQSSLVEALHAPLGQSAKPTCHKCAWDFAVDNKRRVTFNDPDGRERSRTEPRTQINCGGKIWCGDCYERMLFETGQHSRCVGAWAPPYRDALYPPPRKELTEEQKAANRARLAEEMKKLSFTI